MSLLNLYKQTRDFKLQMVLIHNSLFLTTLGLLALLDLEVLTFDLNRGCDQQFAYMSLVLRTLHY